MNYSLTPPAVDGPTKVKLAVDWLKSLGFRNGRWGLLVLPYWLYRGTSEGDVQVTGYYDLIKSVYKDAYLNLRYLEALQAYKHLQDAGVLAPLDAATTITDQDIESVKNDIRNQFFSNTDRVHGRMVSWVGCWHHGCVGNRLVHLLWMRIMERFLFLPGRVHRRRPEEIRATRGCRIVVDRLIHDQRKGRNVWTDPEPVPPWEWRKK